MPPGGTSMNNNFTETYVDIDGDPSTFMSSSDSLVLPNCSEVTWAGLYWGGRISTSNSSYSQRGNVQIKLDNNPYEQVSADQTINNTSGYVSYFCFKNVTDFIQNAGTNARFTVANQLNSVGSSNLFGGWTLVVVYKNIQESYKNLTVFDGLANVGSGTSTNTVTIPISGFLTPLSGPVTLQLGVVAFDGDRNNTGDQILFNGVGTNYVQVFDAIHPAQDMFNSTIGFNGALTPYRNPGLNNTLGYDANIFFPNNAAQNYLGNGATSANIRVTTSFETIMTRVITSAVDIYEPDLRASVFVNDLNGGAVLPGDTLEYTVSGKNIGSDLAVNCFITDTLDIRTPFIPGSLNVLNGPNAGVKTDIAGDDQAEYDATNRFVKFRVGTGATAAQGGSMNNTTLDSVLVQFRVQVVDDCLILQCDSTLENLAYIFGTGAMSGNLQTNDGTSDVYDSFGCPTSANNEVTISTSNCPPVDFTYNQPLCPGDTLQLSALNSQWANYLWSGPQGFSSTIYNPSIANISSSNSGVYELDVSFNGSSCLLSNITNSLVVNPNPVINVNSVNNVSCFGLANGAISTNAIGANPLNYSWTSGQTVSSITGLAPGLYSLVVTDNNSCQTDTSIQITQPDLLEVSAAVTSNYNGTDISCFGSNDGTVSSTVTGGTAPFTYSWSNGQTTPDLTGLAAGTYTLTVTDANGCTANTTVTLAQPTDITISSVVAPVLCFSGATGSVNTTISGGTIPYTILWNNGQIAQNINSLQAGTYEIVVTDINGCQDSLESTVTQPAQPLAVTHTQTNVLCYGDATGAIDISVTGGTPAYNYAWNTGITTEDISGLPIGAYSVQITDANGCQVNYSATISQPIAPLSLTGLLHQSLVLANRMERLILPFPVAQHLILTAGITVFTRPKISAV